MTKKTRHLAASLLFLLGMSRSGITAATAQTAATSAAICRITLRPDILPGESQTFGIFPAVSDQNVPAGHSADPFMTSLNMSGHVCTFRRECPGGIFGREKAAMPVTCVCFAQNALLGHTPYVQPARCFRARFRTVNAAADRSSVSSGLFRAFACVEKIPSRSPGGAP